MTTTHRPPIRILLANVSGVVGQMLTAQIEAAHDMRVIDQVEGQIEVLIGALQGVDVVILGVGDLQTLPGLVSHLLNEFPHIKVLVFSVRRNAIIGYWLGVRRCRIKNLNSDLLLTSIRTLSKITPSV